jgi:hypothetical protein
MTVGRGDRDERLPGGSRRLLWGALLPLLAATGGAVAPGGCGGSAGEATIPFRCEGKGDDPPVGHGPADDFIFGDASLTDWVSYADRLAVVTVVEERELPRERHPGDNDERFYLGRSVVLHVDQTLWTSPGADVQTAPDVITANVWGWQVVKGQKIVGQTCYKPRLEVGGRYVMPLTRYDAEGASRGPLTSSSVLATPGDEIAARDVRKNGYGPVAHTLAKLSLPEMAQALEAAPRDPAVEPFMHLPPVPRAEAVSRARRGITP